MLSVNLSRCRHCAGVIVLARYAEDDIEDGGIVIDHRDIPTFADGCETAALAPTGYAWSGIWPEGGGSTVVPADLGYAVAMRLDMFLPDGDDRAKTGGADDALDR